MLAKTPQIRVARPTKKSMEEFMVNDSDFSQPSGTYFVLIKE